MPTIMAHALLPLALGIGLGRKVVAPRLLIAGAAAAMLPDADVAAFALGIPYADAFGHRGASHALASACIIGLGGAVLARWFGATRLRSFLFLFSAAASHGLLDMLTDGGLGVALLWPWSDARYFAPFRPIAVSPIGVDFLSLRGLAVLASEFLWIGLPCLVVLLACRFRRGSTA
ncbi:inner membrane protein [Sphingomonas laterariae]|uniref:Inner membrane protein n=1 Tax=Edaphosphingomonas laterariae TaxID=861865 RepID=A0A239GTP2_9SPHN|nr:metal-dependent hydrolase [Sphingomonas laterariae]SNS71883.1 inner membrane protein [Sphingomonas laterariae]